MPPTTAAASGSSNRPIRVSAVPWLLTWIVSVLVFAICVGSLEIFWRSRGYRLNVPDSIALWAYHRTRVVGDDPKIIVAIGTSRARADISPEVMTECLPGYRFVQLGINGASSPDRRSRRD
jgi:hypothetical protein